MEEIEHVWVELEAEGLSDLKSYLTPEEGEIGWEIVRIENLEEPHVSYGFCSRYNGLVVGGLPSLKAAEILKEYKLVSSYVDWELSRQLY